MPQMLKKGHFQSLCRSKKLDHLEAESDDQFLGALEDQLTTTSPWEVTLTVNGVPILFKIDTGADVTFSNSYQMLHLLQRIPVSVAQASLTYKCLVSLQLR